jgi:hypothetical protein
MPPPHEPKLFWAGGGVKKLCCAGAVALTGGADGEGEENRDMMSDFAVWGLEVCGVGARKSRSKMLDEGAAVAVAVGAGGAAPAVACGAAAGVDVVAVGAAVGAGGGAEDGSSPPMRSKSGAGDGDALAAAV